uniref:ABC transporter domain-containing protein n=1 Tax=Dunaliella tertiolecta TaxID=3047 RepID=A0A7S3QKV9_DUNTE|mmetsp:Transcript_12730/g.34704  ORF Transcript_12730/g.34704 Transcript_12730/m.34704 type:complete len:305 (-) Transcript_12730:353-1267(-)
MATAEVMQQQEPLGVQVAGLQFSYPGQAGPPGEPFIRGCNIDIPRGSRCLLVGANGAGKTTLLQVLAGKYMVSPDQVRILGRPPFHDMDLTCSGQLSYLGNSWRKDVSFAGYGVPLQADISAGKMIFNVDGVDPARRAHLIRMLDIDIYQRLTTMSDGQRRRVQICMGLLKLYDVLLLDEITVDLDVVGRLKLLEFFRQECEQRKTTIVYATHIFDGLENWVTHLAYMENGQFIKAGPCPCIPELVEARKSGTKLLTVFEGWLRSEREARHARQQSQPKSAPGSEAATSQRTPFMPSKHLAFFR